MIMMKFELVCMLYSVCATNSNVDVDMYFCICTYAYDNPGDFGSVRKLNPGSMACSVYIGTQFIFVY
jgi:hypothetical protein